MGQLIDEDYIMFMAQEINEYLSEEGEISVSDLTEKFDLPSEFLQINVLEKHLGKIIKARRDPSNPKLFFTQAYLQRCKGRIRGALAALTMPTNVSAILQYTGIEQNMFHTLVDEINPAGYVTSKQPNAQYVPHIYTKMQSDWVNNFYRQNGFLEYDAINKLGISNAKQYINKQFPDEELLFLKRCAVSSKLIELTVLPALAATKQFIDLSSLLPSNMSSDDREELFETILLKNQTALSNFVLINSMGSSVVFTTQFLEELMQPCREAASVKAKAAVDNGTYQQHIAVKQLSSKSNQRKELAEEDVFDKRDERRKKAASGKAGGGSQGRETKTKSTKKHPRGGKKGGKNDFDSDDEDNFPSSGGGGGVTSGSNNKKQLEIVSRVDIVNIINKSTITLGIVELNEDIAAMFYE